MSIFRKKIDEITIDDIEKFVSEKHPENIRLEYKQGLSSKDANFQIAKEAAAFANQQGGVILFGVAEDEKTRRPLSIEGIDKNLKMRERVQSVCIDHIYPPVIPEIQECELKSDSSKVIVLVRVEMSDAVPHTINNRTGFYIRSQDRCDPREMTAEEIELLWNRRTKIVERREWLLRRTYERIFPSETKRTHMLTPFILRAIPLYPLQPLVERTELLAALSASEVRGSQGFPLRTSEIKTSSDSIYGYVISKNSEDPVFNREEYGEVNIFGQVSYLENTMRNWEDMRGIVLGWQLRDMLLMTKFLANWYKRLGYWGVIKFILKLENCKGVKFYAPYGSYGHNDELKTSQLDKDIRVEKEFSVADLMDKTEAITEDIFTEYLWGCGLSVHNASRIQVDAWIEIAKEGMDKITCPKCKARNICVIDEVCNGCKGK